jgi:hypothetical protein
MQAKPQILHNLPGIKEMGARWGQVNGVILKYFRKQISTIFTETKIILWLS